MIKFKTLLIVVFLTFTGIFLAQENQNDSITIKNLSFNTKYSDFGSTIFNDSILYFASNYSTNRLIKRKWKPNMQPFLNLYSINTKNNFQSSKVKLNKAVNTKYHESSVAFNSDYTVMYFTRNGESEDYKSDKKKNETIKLKLYKADLINNDWQNIKELPFNNALYSIGHPAISNDQKKLYFISDMPGGYGETDIYSVDILANGLYSTPINLGPKVNTTGKEMFPFIDENNVLYYSSNGFTNNKGGLDIYYYILNEKDHTPTNAGNKINSAFDDFSLTKKRNKKEGFLSSNRPEGKGSDDIYMYKGDFVIYPEKCLKKNEIIVKDINSNEIIEDASINLSLENTQNYKTLKTNKFGIIKINEDCDIKVLHAVVSKKGYKIKKQEISLAKKELKIEIFLNKDILEDERIKSNNGNLEIIIGDVLFDLNKSDIREDAAIILDKIVKTMKDYPEIKVEIGSHTDSRGSDKYNLKLSNERSLSIRNYIISKGISKTRIFGKGYGETKLLNNCSNNVKCKDSKHQINRRTEFTIIK